MKKLCLLIAITILFTICLPITALAEDDITASPSAEPLTSPSIEPSVSPLTLPSPDPTYSPSPDPTSEPTPVVDQLYIDSYHIYDGMDRTYADGYIPQIKDGKAVIVLPLVGQTYAGTVNLKADLGTTTDSPFVFGNYSQSVSGWGLYVFTLEIPLASGRINGSYPVILTVEYLDVTGTKASQAFTVFVTITDGKTPIDPNAPITPEKEAVDKPELFISSCVIEPNCVGGDQEFSVNVTIENIGTLRARSVRLTYGGIAGEGGSACIVPVEANNSIHLENIASGEGDTATFKLKTTKDVLAGNQPFSVTLDYVDLYGGVYTSTRQFLIAVTQPAEISYDPITPPKTIEAGETFSLPANVFNIGKSTLRNVSITVTGAGLFPTSSVFLGDIAPGGTGNGEISVFAGQLSMTEGYTQTYGTTNGKYTITYTEDTGETKTIELDFSMEITEPVIEGEEEDPELTEEPAFQWWVTILVGLAIIAIIVAIIVVAKVMRTSKMR